MEPRHDGPGDGKQTIHIEVEHAEWLVLHTEQARRRRLGLPASYRRIISELIVNYLANQSSDERTRQIINAVLRERGTIHPSFAQRRAIAFEALEHQWGHLVPRDVASGEENQEQA